MHIVVKDVISSEMVKKCDINVAYRCFLFFFQMEPQISSIFACKLGLRIRE